MVENKRKPKFLRTNATQYSKLGVRRKKKQVYRKSRGRDNKIRLHMKGHVRKVKIGFKNACSGRDLINGKKVVMVFNVKELDKIKEGMVGLLGRVGDKKKKEISEEVIKRKIDLVNLDAEKFLKYIEEKMKKAKEDKKERYSKKISRDKKAKEKEDKEKREAEKKKEEVKKESEKLEEKVENKKDEKKTEDTKNVKVEDKKDEKKEKDGKPKTEDKIKGDGK